MASGTLMALSCMIACEEPRSYGTITRHVCVEVQIDYMMRLWKALSACYAWEHSQIADAQTCLNEPLMQTWDRMQGGHRLGRKAAHDCRATILVVLKK